MNASYPSVEEQEALEPARAVPRYPESQRWLKEADKIISAYPEKHREYHAMVLRHTYERGLYDANTAGAAPCSAVFTYDEVRFALCDACRLGIPDVWCDERITHYVGGVEIPCAAVAWRRNREIHAKAHPP